MARPLRAAIHLLLLRARRDAQALNHRAAANGSTRARDLTNPTIQGAKATLWVPVERGQEPSLKASNTTEKTAPMRMLSIASQPIGQGSRLTYVLALTNSSMTITIESTTNGR